MTTATHQYFHPFSDDSYSELLERIGDARIVLIGESTHGTHDFYHTRAELTKRLIEERGFMAVAVEADWPDAYHVNRYVQGVDGGNSPEEALKCFVRFPTWMWRNTVVRDFVRWLHDRNVKMENSARSGFYGLDLYSLHSSMHEVITYLDRVDPEAARRARYRYACIEEISEDPQSYGYAATYGLTKPCVDDVIKELHELRERHTELLAHSTALPESDRAEDELFYAEQNARLAVSAEEYYRSMFAPKVSSWNLRDTHMFETLRELAAHLEHQRGTPAKIVVWAHNSHLGNASATQMGEEGELNLGQLAKEHFGDHAVLIGLTTFKGSVTAANDWDDPPKHMTVRPALESSYESVLHSVGGNFYIDLREDIPEAVLGTRLLERAIGVIYRPRTERSSHYFYARLRSQFDLLLHFDTTRALEPLEHGSHWKHEPDLPDTYPSGL